MKETVYKSLLFSLLITNIWSIVTFFIYYFESQESFYGLETLSFYLMSCWITSGLDVLVLLISLLKKWISTRLKIFLLIISTWLNSFFTILLLIVTLLEIVNSEAILGLYLISNLIISIVSLLMINRFYKTNLSDFQSITDIQIRK
ncbi:hypothetical protein CLU81_2437 [Flavobacterium sp. 9]|nr:hypothetical protein CLU81_2437 [Flavobacterium sp. 9]